MAKEKIVVIDDSPIVRKLAELALEEEGYKVYTAEDGEEGLRISEEVLPSVILVDFIMPRISGYQFCKSARENELLKDIPIILITGKGEDVGKKFAEKFGVVDYFIKPFKSEMLVDKVNSIINAERQRAGEGAPIFEPLQEAPLGAEEPAFQFEAAPVEVPTIAEIPEKPQIQEMVEPQEAPETPVEFGIPEIPELPEDAAFSEKEAQEAPVFSFDEMTTLEEPQPFLKAESDEVVPDLSSFDFNLEGLSAQQIITEGEEGPGVPPMADSAAEIEDMFDFKSIQELEPMSAVEEAETVSVPIAAAAEAETTADRALGSYLTEELPLLVERKVEDVLKRHGLIKPTSILFSCSLGEIACVEIFRLIDGSRLTGRFYAFSTDGSIEIYFDRGLVAYAVTSRHGRSGTPKSGLPAEKELMSEALALAADLRDGQVFFERMELPPALLGMPARMNVTALLLDGIRRKGGMGNVGNGTVFSKQVGDPSNCGLNGEEIRIFALVDGLRNAGEIAGLSGLGLSAQGILSRLAEAGILKS